ncbi:TetR family transcriptional regulator [Aliidongia dinghuensis]|uniref:TetR family transcriptional regulator n=2 Tax=Aliidongia dinghuensis TaxID=1867774 RepID=A0A8J2YTC5_9PROT|nr:TetR family transcriptional regulator [Aliidongia dinghuensis]
MNDETSLGPAREDRKVEVILQAATEVFLEHGFASASMDLVAQRARASKTTLYSRFPSKEALFEATITAKCQASGFHFSSEEFAGLSLEEGLIRIGRRFVDLLTSPEAIRTEQIVTGEAKRFPEVAEIFYRLGPERVSKAVGAYFVEAAKRGLFDYEDPEFAADHFLAALDGMDHCRALWSGRDQQASEAERQAFVERTVRLFLDGLRPVRK